MDDSLKKYIEKNREAFDNKMPSDELWNKIKQTIPTQENKDQLPQLTIDSNSQEKAETIEVQRKWTIGKLGMAASVLIVAGIGTYFLLNNPTINSNEVNTIQSIVKNKVEKETEVLNEKQAVKSTSVIEKKEEVKRVSPSFVQQKAQVIETERLTEKVNLIDSEDEALRMELIQQLNDKESTSNRIDGLAKLNNLGSLTNEELSLLREMVLNDPNTIVRLNAVEILANQSPKQNVSTELTDIFMQQDDPMVQMELINIIAKVNDNTLDSQLIHKLQEMVLDPQTKPFVKDEAYAVLLKN